MFFIENKTTTLRTATAQGQIVMAPETVQKVRENQSPKGNAIELARAAGVMAAKKTWDLIPYCHPMPLDGVSVEFEYTTDTIEIKSVVKTVWKTGVEMEALMAVTVSALTLYDMLKPIDKGMHIENCRVVDKRGGKTTFMDRPLSNLRAAVIVTSDGTYEGKRKDKSGQIICNRLKAVGVENIAYEILPDEVQMIQDAILRQCEEGIDLILTTGGTGLGPRDVTVEATTKLIERQLPGVVEAMRSHGQARTPYAMLSRGIAGVRGKTLLINLPGSSKGTEESMDAIVPYIFHSYPMMSGGKHEDISN